MVRLSLSMYSEIDKVRLTSLYVTSVIKFFDSHINTIHVPNHIFSGIEKFALAMLLTSKHKEENI